MWRTSTGERTLAGPEAELIRAAISDMVSSLEEEADGLADEWPCGVRLFDELSWQQRLALLARVATALFDPYVRAPQLSAVNEATVAALFAYVRRNLIIELDHAKEGDLPPDFNRCYWRRLLAACQGEPNDELYLEADSAELDDWEILVEAFQDQILWDDDWDMPELFMDVEPELSRGRKVKLGIVNNYYTFLAPDIRDADAPALFTGLRQLIGD